MDDGAQIITIDPEIPLEDQEVKSLIICKNKNKIESIKLYLDKRNWPTLIVTNVNEAIKAMVGEKPHFVLISVNCECPKIKMLPNLLRQTFNANVIMFGEDLSMTTTKMLKASKQPNIWTNIISGPSIQRGYKKLLSKVTETEKADRSEPILQSADKENITISGQIQSENESMRFSQSRESSVVVQKGMDQGEEYSITSSSEDHQNEIAQKNNNDGKLNDKLQNDQQDTNYEALKTHDNAAAGLSYNSQDSVKNGGKGSANDRAEGGGRLDHESLPLVSNQLKNLDRGINSESENVEESLGAEKNQKLKEQMKEAQKKSKTDTIQSTEKNSALNLSDKINLNKKSDKSTQKSDLDRGGRSFNKPHSSTGKGAEAQKENSFPKVKSSGKGKSLNESIEKRNANLSASAQPEENEETQKLEPKRHMYPWERKAKDKLKKDKKEEQEKKSNLNSELLKKNLDLLEFEQEKKKMQLLQHQKDTELSRILRKALYKSTSHCSSLLKREIDRNAFNDSVLVRVEKGDYLGFIVLNSQYLPITDYFVECFYKYLSFFSKTYKFGTPFRVPISNGFFKKRVEERAQIFIQGSCRNEIIYLSCFHTKNPEIDSKKNILSKSAVLLEELNPEVKVRFSTYLYLQKNHKFYLYLKTGRTLLEKQKNKLSKNKVKYLYINQEEMDLFKDYFLESQLINIMAESQENKPKVLEGTFK